MAFKSIKAAQDCRESLGIKGKTYAIVQGYVDGNIYDIAITADSNKVEFDFERKIFKFESFNSLFQSMEWNEDEFILTISNTKPEYSFEITFPKHQ